MFGAAALYIWGIGILAAGQSSTMTVSFYFFFFFYFKIVLKARINVFNICPTFVRMLKQETLKGLEVLSIPNISVTLNEIKEMNLHPVRLLYHSSFKCITCLFGVWINDSQIERFSVDYRE